MDHEGQRTNSRAGITVGSLLLLAVCVLSPGIALAQDKKEFRVCADPENMPFSNRQMQGFENKIATVVAKAFDATPSYVWWGQRRGFIRNTMNATLKEGRCNIMIGAPQGYDLVRTTKPYYRSTYFFVYRKGKGLQITSLDDPLLKKLRIGVHLLGGLQQSPPVLRSPSAALSTMVGSKPSIQRKSDRIIDTVADGKIDVAIVWDAVGYFVKHQRVAMEMVGPGRETTSLSIRHLDGRQAGDDELGPEGAVTSTPDHQYLERVWCASSRRSSRNEVRSVSRFRVSPGEPEKHVISRSRCS